MKNVFLLSTIIIISFFKLNAQQWTVNGATLYNDPITTKIGIGILQPKTLLHLNGTTRTNDLLSFSYDAGSGNYWNYMNLGYNNEAPYISFNTRYRNGVEEIDDGSYRATAGIMKYTFAGIQFDTYKHPSNQQGAPTPTWTPTLLNNWKQTLTIRTNGKVSIGEKDIVSGANTNYKLSVDGLIVAKEYVATISNWADYVFEDDYNLLSINDLKLFIEKNKHLPNIPTESEIVDDGLEISNVMKMQMEKIEELTLYVIELNKQLNSLKNEVQLLKADR